MFWLPLFVSSRSHTTSCSKPRKKLSQNSRLTTESVKMQLCPECYANRLRNGMQLCSGLGCNFAPESHATLVRNTQPRIARTHNDRALAVCRCPIPNYRLPSKKENYRLQRHSNQSKTSTSSYRLSQGNRTVRMAFNDWTSKL